MTDAFATVPVDLLSAAEAVATLYRSRSFRVAVEEFDVSRPGVATMTSRRRGETHFILIRKKIDPRELSSWVGFCQSRHADSRVVVVVSQEKGITSLRAMGVGVIMSAGAELTELGEPRDLAFRSTMPDRAILSAKVRKSLAEPYEKFERGDWYEAFGNACTVLEEACRAYLLQQKSLGRLSYVRNGNTVTPTVAKVKKMTLGQLKDVFCNMSRQTPREANLCRALTMLNPARITKVHSSSKQKLRTKVGVLMWTVVNALRELHP